MNDHIDILIERAGRPARGILRLPSGGLVLVEAAGDRMLTIGAPMLGQDIEQLATEIVAGDARAATRPGALLALAMHVIVLAAALEAVTDPAAADDASAAPAPSEVVPPAAPATSTEAEFEIDAAGNVRALPTWRRNSEVTFCRLLLTDASGFSRADVERWSDEQCRAAETWAIAVHLQASDNDDIQVPARPAFFKTSCIRCSE